MPQEIRILKCFKCDMFQGDIVKKSRTWQCKICGEKQSVMQEFGRGNGKECRQHIQKINLKMRNENNTTMAIKLQNDTEFYEPIYENVENFCKEQLMLPLLVNSNISSNYYNANSSTDNVLQLNCNTEDTNNLQNINNDNLKNINNTPIQSTNGTLLNKYLSNERNLKRHYREIADNLSKKSKWCDYATETEDE